MRKVNKPPKTQNSNNLKHLWLSNTLMRSRSIRVTEYSLNLSIVVTFSSFLAITITLFQFFVFFKFISFFFLTQKKKKKLYKFLMHVIYRLIFVHTFTNIYSLSHTHWCIHSFKITFSKYNSINIVKLWYKFSTFNQYGQKREFYFNLEKFIW